MGDNLLTYALLNLALDAGAEVRGAESSTEWLRKPPNCGIFASIVTMNRNSILEARRRESRGRRGGGLTSSADNASFTRIKRYNYA